MIHGSRVTRRLPDGRITRIDGGRVLSIVESDYVDCHSTLFAFKQPGVPARYDRRILPIAPLFASIVRRGRVPEGSKWAGKQAIHFKPKSGDTVEIPLPSFARELSDPGP